MGTHETEEAGHLVESLRVCTEGGAEVVRPTDERYRLFGALRTISTGRRCISGQEFEKVVEHAKLFLLLNRLLLSVLNLCNACIQAHDESVVPQIFLRQEL